ncbi:MAG: carboxypeptidase regulatory-like domain-containing protein [Deltaproteobacteria bacterium]|nr:carboxypeptidase regulatory-like domain-containing protein [Deltaproteobacteria bacterium]
MPSTGKISGINVLIPELQLKATTDSAGRFTFNNLPPGVYLVQAEDNAYKLQDKKTVTISPGTGSSATFTLVPDNTVGTVVGSVPRSSLDNTPLGNPPQFPRTLAAYVAGQYAFLADHAGGVPIVDVSVPTSPRVVKIIDAPSKPTGFLSRALMTYGTDDGNYLVAVFDADGAIFYDVSDKSTPRMVYQVFSIDNSVGGIDPSGLPPDYPNLQTLLSTGDFALGPQAVTGRGNIVYVGGYHVILVFDISNRAAPALRKAVGTDGYSADLAIQKNLLVYADGQDVEIYDISSPFNPSLLGTYLSSVIGDYLGAATTDNVAAISRGTPGVEILDLSNPSNPTLLQAFSDIQSQGVDSSWDGYFYAAAYDPLTLSSWMKVYRTDLSTRSAAEFYSVPLFTNPAYAMNVAVSGNYAYVAGRDDGLKIVKIK